MEDKTREFIEKIVLATIGLVLLLIGALAVQDIPTRNTLITIGSSLLGLGSIAQLLNFAVHDVIDVKYYNLERKQKLCNTINESIATIEEQETEKVLTKNNDIVISGEKLQEEATKIGNAIANLFPNMSEEEKK